MFHLLQQQLQAVQQQQSHSRVFTAQLFTQLTKKRRKKRNNKIKNVSKIKKKVGTTSKKKEKSLKKEKKIQKTSLEFVCFIHLQSVETSSP